MIFTKKSLHCRVEVTRIIEACDNMSSTRKIICMKTLILRYTGTIARDIFEVQYFIIFPYLKSRDILRNRSSTLNEISRE